MTKKEELIREISELKKKHNALLLSHFYEDDDIQDIADEIGDSLFLAQRGQQAENPVVLLAGVTFMGESVKILSPEKTVLVPDMAAGCSLVEQSPKGPFLKWRLENPEALCITYVNSSAEVKALSDVICTSSNAEKILAAIPKDREILFAPDYNLGKWLRKNSGRDMKLWKGACEVHIQFSAEKLMALKMEHPDAMVISHPECEDPVLDLSDVIGSTSKLLKTVKDNPNQKFIVGTEIGIFYQMKKQNPTATLIQAPTDEPCACNECPYMKLNTLEKIKMAFKTLSPKIELNEDLRKLAALPLQRMMDITDGLEVSWPSKFETPAYFK